MKEVNRLLNQHQNRNQNRVGTALPQCPCLLKLFFKVVLVFQGVGFDALIQLKRAEKPHLFIFETIMK
jgi:hypothetical protein